MRFILSGAGFDEVGRGVCSLTGGIVSNSGAHSLWGVNMPNLLGGLADRLWDGLLAKISGGLTAGFQYAIAYSGDICLVTAMILLLLSLFGSKRAARYLYWDFAAYIIINIVGAAFI